MEAWINIHTHRPGRGVNIVDPCLGKVEEPEEGCVFYSAGIHPMFAGEDVGERLEDVRRQAKEGRIVAIGEAGVDRTVDVSVERQLEAFRMQAALAKEYDMPLIVHGVRVSAELAAEAKRMGTGRGWIVHGFNNRREVMADLLRHGMYLSVGRQVMNRESNVWRLLPEIPCERLFIETDDSDWGIEEVYRRVAERMEMRLEDLQSVVRDNFRRVFQREV